MSKRSFSRPGRRAGFPLLTPKPDAQVIAMKDFIRNSNGMNVLQTRIPVKSHIPKKFPARSTRGGGGTTSVQTSDPALPESNLPRQKRRTVGHFGNRELRPQKQKLRAWGPRVQGSLDMRKRNNLRPALRLL